MNLSLPLTQCSTLLFADGPINAEKLTNLYNSKTTAHMASLFEKLPLNDHGESSGSGAGSGDSGSGSGGSGSESGGSASGMGPDPLETLAESVSNTVVGESFC